MTVTMRIEQGSVVLTKEARLELARRAAGLTQGAMAELIEVSPATIHRVESGKAAAKRPLIAAWAMATGVSARWLETGIAPADTGEGESFARPERFELPTFWLGVCAGQGLCPAPCSTCDLPGASPPGCLSPGPNLNSCA